MNRVAVCAALVLTGACLSGCGKSSSSVPGVEHAVVATTSISGRVAAAVGGKTSLNLSFNSGDADDVTDLAVTGLAAMPAGWSGPSSFKCPHVATGSGCLLSLAYAPTVGGSGILKIGYTYLDKRRRAASGEYSIPYAATLHDNVVATASSAGQIVAAIGASQGVNVTFTTDDANAAEALTVTSELSRLPAGWSSADRTFGCASVSSGSGCVLTLTYAPRAADRGTMAFNYAYRDNAGAAKSGAVMISYAATAEGNVAAFASPAGQVNATVGGSQPVVLSFATDDGKPATALKVTNNLAKLPGDWSSVSRTFDCAVVTTGSGCLLNLIYAPTIAASGTLVLNYVYINEAGAAKTGTAIIAYAATTDDNVVGSVSPAGQISAALGGTRAVNLTFTTDDGDPATRLALTTDLRSLPPGWHTNSDSGKFTCLSVRTGSGCLLPLTYSPASATGGTLNLRYAYTDNAGNPKSGTTSIAYAATADGNIVGTVWPAGQINATVGGTSAVNVIFTTDDGRLASALAVTSDLGSLPGGWSSAAKTFTCATVDTGSDCLLPLSYSPTATTGGTLVLNYAYRDSAGNAKTGTANIGYAATVNDNVIGSPAPVGQIHANVGENQNVNLTFTTDDGNPSRALWVSGLSSLPSGWSTANSRFNCATVSTGAGCQLNLAYAPTAPANGTLTLHYGYTDDGEIAKTGTVNIEYTATPTTLSSALYRPPVQ